MNIWQYQLLLMRRLLQWSLFSTTLGAFLMLGHKFWQGVGAQFMGWALIDGLIAYFGSERARKAAFADTASDPERLRAERRNLRILLWFNAALDLLYVRGGLWLALRRRSSIFTRGMGLGIIVQGSFLFLFDLIHGVTVPDVSESNSSVSQRARQSDRIRHP
jgi:hypothetical protein